MAGETLSALRTSVRSDLRDPNGATWSDTEISDLINSGIDWVNGFYPKEAIQTMTYTQPISGELFSVALTTVSWPFRVDVYTSGGQYQETLLPNSGDGPDSGWEVHNGILFFPPHYTMHNIGTLRIFGYAGFVQLSSSSSTKDMDTSAISSVRVWTQAEAFNRLLSDRVAFQQWQVQSGNSDVSALSLNQIALSNQARVRREESRLRRIRRLG
jgi:hypothetical protein